MLARVHVLATTAWATLAAGAGLGFIARDLLELPPPLVALAWASGAVTALASATMRCGRAPRRAAGEGERARRERRGLERRGQGRGPAADESGQATVEWVGLVLVASLALGALVSFALRLDGRSFGGFLAHRITCAVKHGAAIAVGSGEPCRDGDHALARAYGGRDAALVRAHAPSLVYESGERQIPVDWRRCRKPACAEAPDEPDLDVHRSDSGERATVFTRVLRRDGRTYLQYWLYYPDSNTTWAGSDKVWEAAWLIPRIKGLVSRTPRYPGFHPDDWEAYVVRIDPDGSAWVRASAHGHWQGCKQKDCEGEWMSRTGWTRVSRGSHAGHIPVRTEFRRGDRRVEGREALGLPGERRSPPAQRQHIPLFPGTDLHDRTTTGDGLRLIPLETIDRRRYQPMADHVQPPWLKEVYDDPDSEES